MKELVNRLLLIAKHQERRSHLQTLQKASADKFQRKIQLV